ncbi:hypothetical protein BS78_08G079500 [Paspalum vaginatum]|nr:hypothetical protein BS78_08G079500 [Paspalum vaginatum]
MWVNGIWLTEFRVELNGLHADRRRRMWVLLRCLLLLCQWPATGKLVVPLPLTYQWEHQGGHKLSYVTCEHSSFQAYMCLLLTALLFTLLRYDPCLRLHTSRQMCLHRMK